MDARADEQLAERYVVVPAVDVEALRSALRTVAAEPGVGVALGPSLLGTLDMDALPVGMHPFVDPDRRVRPLRDDVVLLLGGASGPRDGQLAGSADLVERVPVVVDPPVPPGGGVLVLVRSVGPDGPRAAGAGAPDVATADELLSGLVGASAGGAGERGTAPGADLYVLLPPDRLAQVLAPRDG